jgi:hypothetical protein
MSVPVDARSRGTAIAILLLLLLLLVQVLVGQDGAWRDRHTISRFIRSHLRCLNQRESSVQRELLRVVLRLVRIILGRMVRMDGNLPVRITVALAMQLGDLNQRERTSDDNHLLTPPHRFLINGVCVPPCRMFGVFGKLFLKKLLFV